jgi:hypothetical protein
MAIEEVVDDDVQVLLGLAVLFRVVCLLNSIGLLLAKIMRRSGDISRWQRWSLQRKPVLRRRWRGVDWTTWSCRLSPGPRCGRWISPRSPRSPSALSFEEHWNR